MPLTLTPPGPPFDDFGPLDIEPEPEPEPEPRPSVVICDVCNGRGHTAATCDSFWCRARSWSDYNRGHYVRHDGSSGIGSWAAGACPACACCSDHCRCVTCPECHVRVTGRLCRSCDRCASCCDCATCSICGGTFLADDVEESMCPTSEREHCRDCCNCIRPDNPYPNAGTPTFYTPGADSLTLNPSPRYASLEIEIANVNLETLNTRVGRGPESLYNATRRDNPHPALFTASRGWDIQMVHDGSIKHANFRRELNTAPAGGDLLIRQLNDIATDLEAIQATANRSCGLHVHVDCRDFSFWDIRRLVFLYEKIEPALFALVDPDRRNNRYCMPCGTRYADAMRHMRMPNEDGAKKALVSNLYGCADNDGAINHAIRNAKYNKYMAQRYSALNLHSWLYRGTVESRIHHGTTNRDNLINWALLWVSIVDRAYAMTEREIDAISEDAKPKSILLSVAPNDSVRDWITSRTTFYSRRVGHSPDRWSNRMWGENADAALPSAPAPATPATPLAAEPEAEPETWDVVLDNGTPRIVPTLTPEY